MAIIKKLFHKEVKELNKIIKELEDVRKRTKKGIDILKKILKVLDEEGKVEKAKELRGEILLLEEEVSDERKAEQFVVIVEETLPKIMDE